MISFCFCPALLQSQHSHLVIQQLLGHLDANSKNSATVRAGIVEVLLEAAAIAASGSVGKLEWSHHMLFCQLLSTAKKANHHVWIRRWALLIITHCLFLQVRQCWRCSTPCCGSSASVSTMSWPVAMTVVPTLVPRSSKLTRRGSCRRLSLGPLVSSRERRINKSITNKIEACFTSHHNVFRFTCEMLNKDAFKYSCL